MTPSWDSFEPHLSIVWGLRKVTSQPDLGRRFFDCFAWGNGRGSLWLTRLPSDIAPDLCYLCTKTWGRELEDKRKAAGSRSIIQVHPSLAIALMRRLIGPLQRRKSRLFTITVGCVFDPKRPSGSSRLNPLPPPRLHTIFIM